MFLDQKYLFFFCRFGGTPQFRTKYAKLYLVVTSYPHVYLNIFATIFFFVFGDFLWCLHFCVCVTISYFSYVQFCTCVTISHFCYMQLCICVKILCFYCVLSFILVTLLYFCCVQFVFVSQFRISIACLQIPLLAANSSWHTLEKIFQGISLAWEFVKTIYWIASHLSFNM